MQGPATDVFLSYKAEDRARLAPLVAALEREGFTVWWDAHIGGGTNWHEDIEQHLDAAQCVIVAWSKRSIGHDGHFVRDEARQALKRDAYLPVLLDPVEPPLGFREVQALPLKSWKGDPADARFQAIAAAVRSHVSGEHVAHHPHVHFHQPRISRRAAMAGGAGIAAVAATGAWLLLSPTPANAKRIAVLPFANLSGADDQAYFAEGIAEELRGALSRIGMQVIGRASSDAVKDLDTKAAAAKLGVGNILTGSVRRSPQMVRIGAQLVDGSDGVERWSQSYDRAPGDEIKVQIDIASSVAQALSIALGQAGKSALTLGGSADSAAQDLILQARKLRNRADGPDGLREILALTEQAIAKDPNYADAYIEKTNVLVELATRYPYSASEVAKEFADAEAAARKAIALAPELGPTYASLAELELGRLNFANGLNDLKRATSLAPNNAEVLTVGARELPWLVDAREGLRFAVQSIALDPLNGLSYQWKASALLVLRRYREAIEAGREALKVAPDVKNAHVQIGHALILLGQLAKAEPEFEAMPPNYPLRIAGEGLIAARAGDAVKAERMIARLKELIGPTRYQYGQIYVQLGNHDRAIAEFERAIEAKSPGMIYLKADPLIDSIRGDRRYAALLKRLNFPTQA